MRFVAVVLLVGSLTDLTSADVFNMGGTRNSVTGQWTGNASLEFVTVGDPGNTADTHGMEDTNTAGCGAVPYTYQMGKYDVTCAQYCKLLNAVAKNDAYGLYDPNMANPASSGSSLVGCGITRSGSPGNYTYSVTKDPNFPANYITWCDAARFCNWLSKGQPTGPEGPGTTETGSYTLNGETSHDPALMAVTRNPGARYVIPGDDEWFKAAYYKGGGTNAGYWLYPARSDTGPSSDLSSTGTNNANCWNSEGGYLTDPANYLTAVGAFAGSPGPYGTFDMGGDLWQWNEAVLHAGQFRGLRGGYFGGSNDYQILACRWSQDPSGVDYDVRIGFRVALVPEPATLSLLVLGGLLIARRRRAARVLPVFLVAGLLAGLASPASADVFHMGGTRDTTTGQWTGTASLEFVTVGDPGNAAHYDAGDGARGAVSYTYQIGKYDMTAAQYCQFLNAVAKTDSYGLYSTYMASPRNLGTTFGIAQSGDSGSYTYSVTGNPNFPMNWITWGDAARFCNWLSNGQPTGLQGAGTTETGSYTLNGATSNAALMAITRNPGATYVIPTADEWYKAAYYKGGGTNAGYWFYPTRSNNYPSNVLSSTGTNNANCYNNNYTDPVNKLTPVGYFAGSPSPYGTFDQGGNVWQWNERIYYNGSARGLRGASLIYPADSLAVWTWNDYYPAESLDTIGFRIALVPEPATLSLLTLGGLLLARRRRA